ncbi:signal transduction histidine kinase/ligand-binding sensor domain-containing protein [Natronospira proteinivora]|uniref:histidine kinase n=1 Tax=Natronospira proteinivora TaxID=1807133 RepID=A0ABT1GA01_9GAMM|nr:hybrid sensor histidine kinase/response regulator [Natronospira proteinivora]MCP1728124.1 signal transduction histidine kinase/ligand-binding sensor domain-containing protein [Natronospira proteinivora]
MILGSDCLTRRVATWAILLVVLLLLLASPRAQAEADSPIPVFLTLDAWDGLPANAVEAFHQDRHGFIWIATQSGLARWDGHRIKTFRHDPGNPDSLPGNHVEAIAEDSRGGLWIGTVSGGVARIDPASGAVQRVGESQGLASNRVLDIAVGPNDRVWVAHPGEGLSLIDAETRSARAHRRAWGEDGRRQGASALLATEQGLWIGGPRGLDFMAWPSGQPVSKLLPAPEAIADPSAFYGINAIHETPDGAILAAGVSGVWIRPSGGAGFEQVEMPLPEAATPSFNGVTSDADGRIWLTSRHGLFHGDGRHFHHIEPDDHPDSLPSRVLRTVYRDRQGLLWLGSESRGAIRLLQAPAGMSVSPLAHQEEPVSAWAVTEHAGQLWLGTERHGVLALDDAGEVAASRLHDPVSGVGDNIWSLASGRQGLWVGTDDLALYYFPDGDERGQLRNQALDELDPARAAALWDLLEDRAGRLWISTNGDGLHRYDPGDGSLRVWRAAGQGRHGLGDDRVTVLMEDPAGRIWVGTEGDGLYVWMPEADRFRHIPTGPESLLGSVVEALAYDSRGRVWVGSYDGGLTRLSPDGEMEVFGANQGLPSDSIIALEVDDQDRVWAMTDAGLARISADGTVTRLGLTEGVPALSFHAGAHGQSPSGALLFAAAEGLLSLHPEQVEFSDQAAPLRLTGLRVMGQDRWGPGRSDQSSGDNGQSSAAIWQDDELVLNHHEPAFSVDFALLDYRDPGAQRYRYRLDGLDRDWQYVAADRAQAAYTNLPPGHYQLEVQVMGREGGWQALEQSLAVHLPPPPWRSTAAYAAYGLATLLLLISGAWFWHERSRREAALQQERRERQWVSQLHQMARWLGEPADRNTLLERFLEQLLEILPVEAATVRLERSASLPPLRVKRARPGCSGLSSDDQHLVSLPLATRRRRLGLLHVRPQAGHAFSERDKLALAATADQAAQALDTALLVDEADAANRAKSSFLAKLSHEIRTPVSGMLGLAGLLLRESLEPRSRDYAQAIQSSGQGLMAILSDILDNARLEAGRMEIHPAPFDLVAAVEDTAALHAASAVQKAVPVVTHVSRELPRRVIADEVRFRQILGNLLSNAVKFTENGAITVEMDRYDASRLRLTVSDTGPGMSDEAVERLFQPFSQVESKRTAEGSGLGLVICRELARLMGGDIHLDTAPGDGARFEVIFAAEDDGGERRITQCRREITVLASPGPAAELVAIRLAESGLKTHLETAATAMVRDADDIRLVCDSQGVRLEDDRDYLDWPVREDRLAALLDRADGLSPEHLPEGFEHHLPPPGRGHRLLVAEDNPVNARVVSDVLATEGYQVVVVESGEAVLESLKTDSYAAVLMDRYMPGMDGLATTRALRRQGYQELPVIGLTAADAPGTHEECRRAGMNQVVVKDGDPGPLLAALRALI